MDPDNRVRQYRADHGRLECDRHGPQGLYRGEVSDRYRATLAGAVADTRIFPADLTVAGGWHTSAGR